jgi:hypothetical protein
VDDYPAAPEQPTFLFAQFGLDPCVIASTGQLRSELGRSEETAVLHAVEGRIRQEVEGADPREVRSVVLESLAPEVAGIDSHRLATELEHDPAEPRLEHGRPLAGLG